MTKTTAIHFAVTSHGFGHLTRCLAILRSLNRLAPSCSLFVSTTADTDWLRRQFDFPVQWRHQDYEPGALQRNCFEVDVPTTLDAYRTFREQYANRLERELAFLRSHSFVGVISDIPALPVQAANEVGIPAIGISNFTWDWILEPWCDDEDASIVSDLTAAYATGALHLRLPFGPAYSPFQDHEPAPLVSRRATKSSHEVRRALSLPEGRVALVCPGGWSGEEWPHIHARPGDFHLVTVGDLPVSSDTFCLKLPHQLPSGLTLPDLVACSNVVLGKPGYGLASECVTHHVPFAMIERPNFRETPCLMQEMAKAGRCSTSTLTQFFSGDWEPILEEALTGGSEWMDMPADPSQIIAQRVLDLFGVESRGLRASRGLRI